MHGFTRLEDIRGLALGMTDFLFDSRDFGILKGERIIDLGGNGILRSLVSLVTPAPILLRDPIDITHLNSARTLTSGSAEVFFVTKTVET